MRRILALLGKDLLHGPKGFIFIQAIITPVICVLMVTLLFGSLFTGKPRVGLLSPGDKFTELIQEVNYIRFFEYTTLPALTAAVQSGKLDLGIVFPLNFDRDVQQGTMAYLKSYIWGESLLKDRAIIFAGLTDIFIELAGKEVQVDVQTISLGSDKSLNQRFLPLLILLAIMMSGLMIPASTFVDEKQRHTLAALQVTPISITEVLTAKILLGFLISTFMGVLILVLNGSIGSRPGLLLLALALAAAFASVFGGLAGVLNSNINTLMTFFKSVMMIMYAPGILTLFPRVPAWIARVFPTYYLFNPVVAISQDAAGIREVGRDLLVLTALIIAMILVVILVSRRKALQQV